jgi:ATP-binding cassette, subfamily B, bacterial
LNIDNRNYNLLDLIRIPFKTSSGIVSLLLLETIVSALIPSLQIIITAYFIDTAIAIFNGQEKINKIYMSLVCILLMLFYRYVIGILMGLVRTKINNKLTEAFQTAITEKRGKLEYKHIENNDTWDLIERVGRDPAGRLFGGFDSLLQMTGIAVRVVSTLLIIMAQVWWAGFMILIFTIPLFWLAVKSGKVNYKASQEATKYMRRAEYLRGILTGRDNVEERTLFSYSDAINKQYYDKFLSAYHINLKTQRSRFIKMKSASLLTVSISIIITGILIAPLGSGAITVGMFMVLATSTFDLAQMMSWRLTRITSELANHREYLRDLSDFSKLSETACVTQVPVPYISELIVLSFVM